MYLHAQSLSICLFPLLSVPPGPPSLPLCVGGICVSVCFFLSCEILLLFLIKTFNCLPSTNIWWTGCSITMNKEAVKLKIEFGFFLWLTCLMAAFACLRQCSWFFFLCYVCPSSLHFVVAYIFRHIFSQLTTFPLNSAVVKGVVCKKNVAHRRMTSKIEKPRILILEGALEYQRVSNLLSSFDTLLQQVLKILPFLPKTCTE